MKDHLRGRQAAVFSSLALALAFVGGGCGNDVSAPQVEAAPALEAPAAEPVAIPAQPAPSANTGVDPAPAEVVDPDGVKTGQKTAQPTAARQVSPG